MAKEEESLSVGLEQGGDGGWIAHCFRYPGATLKVPDGPIAPALVRRFAVEEAAALAEPPPSSVVVVEQVVTPTALCREGDTQAMFHAWRHPLTKEDLERGERYLAWSRGELRALWAELSGEIRNWRPAADKRSLREIVSHVADAEAFYLVRLSPEGASMRDLWHNHARQHAPVEVRLAAIRDELIQTLLRTPRDRVAVHEPHQETWTPAKVLYRAIWHERHHTRQIVRYLVS